MAVLFLWSLWPEVSRAYLYTIKANVRLRSGPGTNHRIVRHLDHNQTLTALNQAGGWVKVMTQSGQQGFVRQDTVSDVWIKIHKKERRLYVLKGDKTIGDYPVGLCPFNPLGDKERQGDGGTPEGRFFICESIKHPRQAKYGARSLRLSYPGIEDARRGLGSGLIDFKTYLGIVRKIRAGLMPSQKTPLGGSIRIHGGGGSTDWTLGCVALEDDDIIKVYDLVGSGTRVEVYRSARQDQLLNTPGYLTNLVLAGAEKQLIKPALYTDEAAGAPGLSFPMGDIRPEIAVCTDIIIRAFRQAGLDLQTLIHEDILIHPQRYEKWIKSPNYHIDHRRTRNLQIWLEHHTRILPLDRDFQPGDIVTMDTGIVNGTEFDHIGILDDQNNSRNLPLVINIWTTGLRTAPQDLLGRDYPTVVGHFCLTHPFDYQ